jgi:hypothetical protein
VLVVVEDVVEVVCVEVDEEVDELVDDVGVAVTVCVTVTGVAVTVLVTVFVGIVYVCVSQCDASVEVPAIVSTSDPSTPTVWSGVVAVAVAHETLVPVSSVLAAMAMPKPTPETAKIVAPIAPSLRSMIGPFGWPIGRRSPRPRR